MTLKNSLKSIAVLFFLLNLMETRAQSCGFGCLGLSGFFGGYSIQNYDPEGLNNHINNNALWKDFSDKKIDFNQGTGFRIGVNLFRARFNHFFFSVKGFYQFLKEEKTFRGDIPSGKFIDSYKLLMNYWGVGADFGLPLFRYLDLKIIEGGVTFNNFELVNTSSLDGNFYSELNFKNSKTNIGYYVSSGLIINVIPDYISIEGSATMNFMNIEHLTNDRNERLPESGGADFLKEGGLSGLIQLNLGIPL